MNIFYRSLQAITITVVAILSTQPLHAQLTNEEKEEIREHAKDARATSRLKGPQAQLPVTKNIMQLPAPQVVNFQECANWDLAHPKTDFTKRNMEDHDGMEIKFHPQPMRPGAQVLNMEDGNAGRGNGNNSNNLKSSVNSPAPIISFNGVMGDGSVIPPDINAAAGLTYVMETTNQTFGIYNKRTGALVSSVQITTFFNASGGNGYFDPHILYDAVHGKWLAVIDGNTSTGHGGLFLAVSKTSDPTGNWYVYTVDDGVAEATLLDFPEMGYNENWVVLTANLFSSNVTAEIYVMDRASLYTGTQGTITHFTDANSFCISPAQTFDTTQLTQYLVQDANGANAQVQVGTITGPVGAPVYTAGNQLAASVNGVLQTWNETAVQAAQKGASTLIDNDDTRIYESQYINGSLWFAHTVWLPATGTATYSGVDWWQVNPATPALQQFGRIAASGTWYYYPNIYANANGDALLGYSVSSSSEYASAVYSFHAATDAANTMENLYNYQAGVSSFAPSGFGGDYRWGDYTGVAIDPTDNSFWVSGEWANNSNMWGTQIAHVASSAPVTIPPVANFQANTTTSCTGVIQFTDLSTNSPTSWLWTFGDGSTSALQNPTHTYLNNGTYTVTLKATNTYGNNTKTITSYVTINEPAGPAATGASHCGSSTFSLSATTTNPVSWYDSAGTLVSSSNPFVTPTLNHTTTYYVSETLVSTDTAGPAINTSLGGGGYLDQSPNWALTFDVLNPGTLKSVYVYAQAATTLTVTIANSGGTTINTATVSVPSGGSRVALNFPLTVGTGYNITYTSTGGTALYRNNAGAAYPYTDANGIVSITGNTAAATTYYYWFYDWYITGAGCNTQATPVTATVASGLNTNATLTPVSCFGGNNGSATVTPSGGTPAYTYSWSNGQTGATLTNVTAATYHVTITDAGGCSATATEVISQPAVLNISVTPTSASCGSITGSAAAAVSGGTSSYSYLWSNGATTAAVSNLAPAAYRVTVTDAHSCTVSATTTITSSGSLNITAVPGTTNCSGGSTGSASATVSGGISPFTYTWSNGTTTASITGVSVGTYTVSVSDHSGCSGTASVVISAGSPPHVTTSFTNVSCFNSNNGSASVTVSSGTSPYAYAWNNGGTTATISNLAAGSYYVTVTDARSCVVVDTLTVTQPGSITVMVSTIQPTCTGLTNGSATVSASGGTPSYTYNWSTNTVGTGVTGLGAGSYSVTLTDANSCTSPATFSITDPVPVSASVTTANDSCFGSNDGAVQITPAGGTSPYSYLWSNSGTASTIANLAAGSYTVTVQDVHNCSATISASVSQPAQLTVTTSTTDAGQGQSNGTATVGNVTGGNPPYVVNWSNGTTGNAASNLAGGNYTVTVTDHNGCEATASVTVNVSVGIATVNNDLSFSIYPNPAKTEVTIDARTLDKETSVVLEDILGQSLMVKNITTSPVTIDLGSYSNGVYFIELVQNGKRAVKKFVISR